MSAEKNAESILGSANSTAQHVRGVYLTFLLLVTYFAIIIGATTDVQLLKVSPVTLPLLNVELPILEFYALTPWLLFLLHFNLLLQSYLLGRKLHLFNQTLRGCDEQVASSLRDRLFSFALCHNIVMNQHPGLMRFLLNSMIVISVVVLPLVVLTWAQARFIPYHSEGITWSHRIVIALDCVMLWAFWPRIMLPEEQQGLWWAQMRRRVLKKVTPYRNAIGKRIRFIGEAEQRSDAEEPYTELQRTSGQKSLLFSSAILLFISWFVAVIPDDDKPIISSASLAIVETMNSVFDQFFHVEIKGLFRQNLYIEDEVLLRNEPSTKVMVALQSGESSDKHAAFKEITGLNLQDRDMRHAVFINCVMPKANLDGANLKDASFANNQLQGSSFTGAQMQRVDLYNASLQGVSLNGAQMQDANLGNSRLNGANMLLANLQAATLSNAQLQGAELYLARLQGADLSFAQLQGANLRQAELQGADMTDANLRGADMSGAKLSGTKLMRSELGLANLSGAKVGELTDSLALELGIRNKVTARIGKATDFAQITIKRSSAGGSHAPLCDSSDSPTPGCKKLSENKYYFYNWGRFLGYKACSDKYMTQGLYNVHFVQFAGSRQDPQKASQLQELANQLMRTDCVGNKILDDNMKQKLYSALGD